MSGKPGKALIGAFVLGALALLMTAALVISSGRLFSDPLRFVVFFDSSLKGLSPGSLVVFRGVPIGRVSAIRLSGDVDTLEFLIPVYVELDTSVLKDLKNIDSSPFVDEAYMQEMLQHGLRARLNNQSFLTGQLLITLDFYPDAIEHEFFRPMPKYDSLLVIPSIPSQFDEAWHRLSELPIDEIMQKFNDILEKVDAALADQAVKELPGNLNSAVLEARSALGAINTAMESFNQLAATLETVAGQLDRSLESVRGVVGPNTVAVLELTRATREIGEAAKALRSLAAMLERHPESLLMGKGADRR